MINRAFQFLSTEVRGLHAAVYVLAASAFLSSLLALFRDRLLAHIFGAGLQLDLYNAAFRIPDFLFVALGALVSIYMLIPELAKREGEEQRDYFDSIVVGFFTIAIAASFVAAFFAPLLLKLLFPHVGETNIDTLTTLTRIMLLQPILLGFSNILAAITQARHRYALYSLSPLLYNLGIIFGAVALYPYLGLQGLAWGVVIGAFFHFAIQIPSVTADGFLRRLPLLSNYQALLHTAALSVPRALALSMSQVALVGLVALAGGLATGSIAVFTFAFNLQAVPLGIIGASYSVAAFPTLAAALSNGRAAEFLEHVALAARQVIFWSLPATALIIVLRAHIVRAILGSGAFDWTDTRLTAASVAIFSLCLASQGLTLIIVRGYYAAGRTFVPFFVSIGMMISTIALGIAFTTASHAEEVISSVRSLFRLTDVPGAEILSLPLAFTLASIGGTIVLTYHFEKRFRGFLREIRTSFVQSAVAAVAAGVAAYFTLRILASGADLLNNGQASLFAPIGISSTLLSIFTTGFIAGVIGLCVAAFVYARIGNREYAENFDAIRSRLWRKSVLEVQPVVSAEDVAQ